LKLFKQTYLFLVLTIIIVGCKSTKFVPKDRYLLQENSVTINGGDVDKDKVESLIRQNPNSKLLGMRLNLYFYNRVDSLKVAEKRESKNLKIRATNKARIEKASAKNNSRIAKAKKHNKTTYKHVTPELKDTLEPPLFIREFLKYKKGEEPVVFDSLLFGKTVEQLKLFLRRKGYYDANAHGTVTYNKRRKAFVNYVIETGEVKTIDSVTIDCPNPQVKWAFDNYITRTNNILVGKPFDIDLLDEYRTEVATELRNAAFYEYKASHLVYTVDTFKSKSTVSLDIKFNERMVPFSIDNDSLVEKPYYQVYVQNVYFHILDTTYFKGNYSEKVDSFQLTKEGFMIPTFDTLFYDVIADKKNGGTQMRRMAYFLYNGELFLHPELLEVQNLLEKSNLLIAKNMDITRNRLVQMGLFQTIKMVYTETARLDNMDVHFYLVPNKKSSFSLEPRVTTSNGFLGLSAGINYSNKNLFRGAEKLTFSINGGFQAQPVVFDTLTEQDKLIKDFTTKYYQFEIGPIVKLELPGLFPLYRTRLNKTRLGKTIVSAAYNYQKREVFSNKIVQLNYSWKYLVGKNQTIQMGLPGLSVIKFVNINPSTEFEQKINSLNDIFLQNTYSDQFVWQDWKLIFEYRNVSKLIKGNRSTLYFTSSLDFAGNIFKALKKYQTKDVDGLFVGQNRVFGLVYSQFGRLDNQLIYSHPIKKTKSINLRGIVGAGVTYGNSQTSMPYDYSFFTGGANDIRGWKARALGPGSYKYYLDTTRTALQLGDIRLSASAEYRFQFNKFVKSAFFIDAGNIWTVREDVGRPGSKFTGTWFNEIAISSGLGMRLDFDFFIFRLDLSLPFHNPALPIGERWIFQKQTDYHKEIEAILASKISDDARELIDATPFSMQLSFGIGYPF
jgi:outer membrane protein insertion porin family